MVTVAVVGMGRMGRAMAGTLKREGFDLVLWNRTRERANAVAAAVGAEVVASPRAAAARADVIVSSLADDRAVVESYGGGDGLVAGLRAGSAVLETSTIDPETVHQIARQVAARDAALLDSPVSGSVSLVEQGSLTIMVGGPFRALERARPVLDALAARVFHVGDSGTGATMKLAVNAVVHALNVSVSEALVLAEKAGVDRSAAYEVLAASAAGAPFVQYKRAAFEKPDETPVAFSLDLVAKDLELIAALAQRLDLPLRQVRTNLEIARRAVDSGFGERDMSALAVLLRQQPA